MPDEIIILRGVSKHLPMGGRPLQILQPISLGITRGQFVAVMGPSGSGKSTLLSLLAGLEPPSTGEIVVNGAELTRLNEDELARFRGHNIGFVFQAFHLIPNLTALENILVPLEIMGVAGAAARARELLDEVGLSARGAHYPAQLSGGEQQRVCIARALINDPHILVADEPTGSLDAANEEIVMRLLRDLHRQGRTVIMVTHDPVVARLADRRVDLHHGRIASQEIFAMADEEQFDEVLEEMWVINESNELAEVGRMSVPGALPVSLAVDKMRQMGLVTVQAHPPQPHGHKPVLDRCHDFLRPAEEMPADGDLIVGFTDRGRQRAADIIRRHRLAERLFMETLHMQDEQEIEQQACKFEHILSPEATEKICTFLGHPKTCPHGSPIPPGVCCGS